MGSVLRCVEGPAVGGDTIWVDMVQAYKRLPEHVKTQIAGLRARHSIEATSAPSCRSSSATRCMPGSPTPSTRSWPPTRRPARRSCSSTRSRPTSPTSTTPSNVRYGFDYSPGGSELLNYLIRQASVPEYQVRWRWTPNSFAIWDNRCTQHYAVQDYLPGRPQDGARRHRR